jgi:zinc protease
MTVSTDTGGLPFIHRVAALAVLALLAVGFIAPGLWTERPRVFGAETFILDNGLEVIVVENHRAPVVFHSVWYRIGAADEPSGKSGIAHFLEHLMFKGTKTREAGEFSRLVALNGGSENAFTSQDYTGYFQKIARDRLELVMELEADRMANLVLSDEVVLPERDVVLEERASRTDNDPGAQFSERFAAEQFQVHPYGIPIIGYEHEIAALTTEDAIAFYQRYYAPNNAALIVVGDITADEMRVLAERYYGPVAARDVPERVRTVEPAPDVARRLEVADPRVRQAEWSRSYLAPSQNAGETEHAYPLIVLSNILSGTTGRLYRSLVVERMLAAHTGVWYDDFYFDKTQFYIYATPAPGADLAALEAAIDDEIDRVLREGVTREEVESAKTRVKAEAVFASDSLYMVANIFGDAFTSDVSVEEVESWFDRIDAVTPEQINAAARLVLHPERAVTGVLRPGDAG